MTNEKLGEQVSALLDGELSTDAAVEVLDALSWDDELRGRWERYQLVREAMRNSLPKYIGPDLAGGISRKLEAEPAILAPQRQPTRFHPALKPAAGLAVAASVALLTIAGLRSLTENSVPVSPVSVATVDQEVGAQSTAPVLASNPRTAPVSPSWEKAGPGVESTLNRYLVNHYEYASANGMKGMLPYVTIVGYEP